MALTGAKIRERHLVTASDFGVDLMNRAGESVRRKPLRHGACIKERAIDSFGRGAQHAVKLDSICSCCHNGFVLSISIAWVASLHGVKPDHISLRIINQSDEAVPTNGQLLLLDPPAVLYRARRFDRAVGTREIDRKSTRA